VAKDLSSNKNIMASKATGTYPKGEKGKILATRVSKTSGCNHGHVAIILFFSKSSRSSSRV